MAHLDQRASEDDVQAMFAPFGPVLNVRIIVDRDTGASKGYGFVTMAAPAMAQARSGFGPCVSIAYLMSCRGLCAVQCMHLILFTEFLNFCL